MENDGFCPECHQWFSLKKDGTLVSHGWRHDRAMHRMNVPIPPQDFTYVRSKEPCKGSGMKPVDLDNYISPKEFNKKNNKNG